MHIRYERPLPDLRYLIRAPLRLDLGGGREIGIEQWCPEGFVPPARLQGDDGAARLIIPFHQFDISFPVTLLRDPDENLMRFVDLGPREARLLSHFYREIVTGRAVSEGAVIASMDTPVERVPMERTPDEIGAEPRPAIPRAARVVAVCALYAVLAVLLVQPMVRAGAEIGAGVVTTEATANLPGVADGAVFAR